MIERLPPEIAEILEQQGLEKSLRAKRDFVSLPEDVQSLVRKIDKLKEPLLVLPQRETALAFILWMNNPNLKDIADLLGKEVEEIRKQRNQVIKGPEDKELLKAISRLTNDGNSRLPSFKQPAEYLNSEFLEEVKRLREKGLDNQTIAEKLGVEPNHLQYAVSILIKNGEIKSRSGKRSNRLR